MKAVLPFDKLLTYNREKYPWRNGYVNHWDVPRWGVAYFDWKHQQNTTFAQLMKKLGYKTCAVTYTTHAVGGLSENDFICAAKLDALIGDL